jgi:nucleoside-diphosphate-sugar epimerase
MKFFIFGFGYTAKNLAPELITQGFDVIGTTRTPDKIESKYTNLKIIDLNYQSIEENLNQATHILICIPPVSGVGDIVLKNYHELIIKQSPHLKWLGYLSSTSVYGDKQGDWVNEESACSAHTPTGISRLNAETAWYEFAKKQQLPLHIFRLSGIYGPDRNAISRLIQGKNQSVFKENQVFCRIHVDDIVATLLASIKSPKPLSIYNVSDDEPAPTHVVDSYAASLIKYNPPTIVPFANAKLSPMEQEFYSNNRRVSNFKIKNELNVHLKYPSYKEGLMNIWENYYSHAR